jgi:ATP-dependent DNA helicase DinG
MIAPLDLVAEATRMLLDDYAETETQSGATANTRELRVLDPSLVSADLGPHGPVARAMQRVNQRFEDRPTQRAMAEAVVGLYNSGGVGLLEAGTGVGKSLGYLIPALRWAAANGERTVVSTNTINL